MPKYLQHRQQITGLMRDPWSALQNQAEDYGARQTKLAASSMLPEPR
jgi:hypothetical protein